MPATIFRVMRRWRAFAASPTTRKDASRASMKYMKSFNPIRAASRAMVVGVTDETAMDALTVEVVVDEVVVVVVVVGEEVDVAVVAAGARVVVTSCFSPNIYNLFPAETKTSNFPSLSRSETATSLFIAVPQSWLHFLNPEAFSMLSIPSDELVIISGYASPSMSATAGDAISFPLTLCFSEALHRSLICTALCRLSPLPPPKVRQGRGRRPPAKRISRRSCYTAIPL